MDPARSARSSRCNSEERL